MTQTHNLVYVSDESWWFLQNVYLPCDIVRSLKAGEGSGNIPKVIVKEEDNADHPID